jgi:SAM-dependent methyltransferase
VVADVFGIPVADGAVDVAAAAGVLNHLRDPSRALQELGRAVRPAGWIVASVFSAADRPPAKAAVDGALERAGWERPDWYRYLKSVDGQLGSAGAMRAAADEAGLGDVTVVEQRVDTGVTEPVDIVRFRFAQPHAADFVAALPAPARQRLEQECIEAVAATGQGLIPGVVLLAATVVA